MAEAHEVVKQKCDAQQEVQNKSKKLQKKEKKLKNGITKAKTDVAQTEKNCEKAAQTASEFGERPESKDLTDTVKEVGTQLNKKMQEMERLKRLQNASFDEEEDIEILEGRAAEAQANFDLAEKEFKRAKNIQEGLQKRLSVRLNDYKTFRRV